MSKRITIPAIVAATIVAAERGDLQALRGLLERFEALPKKKRRSSAAQKLLAELQMAIASIEAQEAAKKAAEETACWEAYTATLTSEKDSRVRRSYAARRGHATRAARQRDLASGGMNPADRELLEAPETRRQAEDFSFGQMTLAEKLAHKWACRLVA